MSDLNEVFLYEWREMDKGYKRKPALVIQAVSLALFAGLGPEFLFWILGYDSVYHFRFMLAVVVAIILMTLLSCEDCRKPGITESSLLIDGDVARVTRHVTSDTGRRFFAVWDSMEVKAYRVDELHRVIQVDAVWKVSAYRMKGKKPGKFVDSDVRAYTQTFLLGPEDFYRAVGHLNANYLPGMVAEMAPKEYEKALPFIHKHYEL